MYATSGNSGASSRQILAGALHATLGNSLDKLLKPGQVLARALTVPTCNSGVWHSQSCPKPGSQLASLLGLGWGVK